MSMTHVTEILEDRRDDYPDLALPLWVGAGYVDPALVCPSDELDQQNIEDLIAFRTSSL
jgi:hypothetical protein